MWIIIIIIIIALAIYGQYSVNQKGRNAAADELMKQAQKMQEQIDAKNKAAEAEKLNKE